MLCTGKMRRIERIAVDLTPLLPGAGNGGAKLMTLELIRGLAALAPRCEFVLLTSDRSHDELARLEGANVRRQLVHRSSPSRAGAESLGRRLAARLPSLLRGALAKLYLAVVPRRRRDTTLLPHLKADLLFCPFTAPYYHDGSVPCVAVIYDLQHKALPGFFGIEEIAHRDQVLRDACRAADAIVCISDYVRQTVMKHASVDAARLHAIPIQLPQRLARAGEAAVSSTLRGLSLEVGEYLLFPANLWPHKNHDALLEAFALYRGSAPASRLKLVCTGADSGRRAALLEACARLKLQAWAMFPGYVGDADLAALLQGCAAMIYPSLYEGFGMPIVEAMAAGRPVLCSAVASISETAGDAALYFDPRRPEEIAAAIRRIVGDRAFAEELGRKGAARARALGDPSRMAAQYWSVFERVLAERPRQA